MTKNMETANAVSNLKKLLSLKVQGKPMRLLYLNLTHFQQNGFCNHAFAMKKVRGREIQRIEFTPQEHGITPAGFNILEACFGHTAPVMVCVKHMSLISRKQYYAFHNNRVGPTPPLIGSHMGFAGFDSKDMPKYMKYACLRSCQHTDDQGLTSTVKFAEVTYDVELCKGVGGTFFNPWTINIYDDEIKTIFESGGIIGLNLDQRILGVPEHDDDYPERFSESEFHALIEGWENPPGLNACPPLTSGRCFGEPEVEDFPEVIPESQDDEDRMPDDLQGDTKEKRREWHLRHLASHILHAIYIDPIRAPRQLALGSDYDGLIDPIDGFECFRDMYELEEVLPPVLVDLGMRMTQVETRLGQKYEHNIEMTPPEAKKLVKAIMYDNALKVI